MGSEKNGVFHCNSIMNCTSFEPMFKSPNGMDPLYASSNWDPIVSLNQSGSFGNSSNMVAQNELDHFSDMVSSFDHIPQLNHAIINPENGMLGHSPPYGKRKRKILIQGSPKDAKEEDEKKQNFEGNVGPIYRNKLEVKQSNEDSSGAEPSKENYIHMRAKRGQATNSHSLAERVRRERISERMRLLQELVPGCNKITGKAVMLDEIINYVQSLQHQVEFLSMKLATVNPEMNVDIDHILFKDGYPQGTFNVDPGVNPPFHSLPQYIRSNELQSILQMGFDFDPSVSSLGLNEMEL